MGNPTISWRINTGTEGSPSWTALSGTDAFWFLGAETTASIADPVRVPDSGTKFPEELWKAVSASYASGVQCTTYEQDISAATNTNIVAVQFDTYGTSTAPEITAWDDNTRTSTAKEILSGTTAVPHCLFRGGITADNVLPAAGAGSLPSGWTSQTSSTDTFKLEGDTHKQTASVAIDAGKQVRLVLTVFVPYDLTAGIPGHDPVTSCKYTYT